MVSQFEHSFVMHVHYCLKVSWG